ncbi:uncharacterized protein LOC143781074 [Ranitomeya variabilis]|uniref:uncharacterized protein LOC143781074 n=1 Tax=Ranitomeya variabilis TaxID=490064 RepID=UPI00405708DD
MTGLLFCHWPNLLLIIGLVLPRWSLLFFCNSGFHPRFSSGQGESSDCPGVDVVVDRLHQIWNQVVDNLKLSQEKTQQFANRRRRVGPRLLVGDLVWLSSRFVPMKVSSPKFKPRFIGPYRISEILNPVSFRLDLPASFAIHNVFHRSLLRRYEVPVVPSVEPPAPVLVEGELEYVVEKILDSRVSRRKLQYLVKWKGYGQEDNSWVVASDVHATDLVRAFHRAHPDRPGGSREGSVTPPQGGVLLWILFVGSLWWLLLVLGDFGGLRPLVSTCPSEAGCFLFYLAFLSFPLPAINVFRCALFGSCLPAPRSFRIS